MSIDTDGTIRLMNESGHRVLGYQVPELIGKNWFDTCLPEEVREDVRRYINHLGDAETDEVVCHENEVVTKTGERKLISWRDSVYRRSDKTFIGSYGAGEAENAQIQLAKAAEKLNGFTADTVDYRMIADTMRELSDAKYVLMNVHEKNGKDFTTVAFSGLPKGVEKASALVGFPIVGRKWSYTPAWDEKEAQIGDDKTVVFSTFEDLVGGILPGKVIKLVSATFNNGPAVIVKTSRDGRILGRFLLLFERESALRNRPVAESYADMIGMLLFRIEIEEKNSALIHEKENLLKEVHHRIKNNMYTMGSLLSLQAASLDTGNDAVAILNEAKSRLRSMEVLYDQLYRTEAHDGGSIREYLLHLVHKIIEIFPAGELVTVSTEIDDFYLDARTLSILGMIVNELVTNTMKYAFNGRLEGRLSIHVRREKGKAAVTIEDDGPGLPRNFDMSAPSGFGTLMVKALSEQLDGTIRVKSCTAQGRGKKGSGTSFTLEFPLEPQ